MTRLRLTLSIAGLSAGFMGAIQRNRYLVWIAIALLAASVVLRLVEARSRRADGPAPPPDGAAG